jgi:hypothetical protein
MSSPAQPALPEIQHVNPPGQKLPLAPTPKKIEAESRSRNSFERLFIVRLLAIGLVIALGLDVVAYYVVFYFTPADHSRPYNDHVKDILLVISSVAAYLLGYGSGERKDDK